MRAVPNLGYTYPSGCVMGLLGAHGNNIGTGANPKNGRNDNISIY